MHFFQAFCSLNILILFMLLVHCSVVFEIQKRPTLSAPVAIKII
jgi:hypothetical protein